MKTIAFVAVLGIASLFASGASAHGVVVRRAHVHRPAVVVARPIVVQSPVIVAPAPVVHYQARRAVIVQSPIYGMPYGGVYVHRRGVGISVGY